jgi:hypothetical protein
MARKNMLITLSISSFAEYHEKSGKSQGTPERQDLLHQHHEYFTFDA